ncbi:MAG: hypothetical protein ACLFNU_03815 [Bacteroidales bacterium]
MLQICFVATVLLTSKNSIAQEVSEEVQEPKINFYGYVSYEAIFDSHESVFTRDGELYLFPKAPQYHPQTGDLINSNPQLEMLSLQSRVGASISGSEVMGAKLSGLIEADFFATAEDYKHHLRIRHALMKLQWDKFQLTMGQYWHPMFTPEVFPRVISFGAGAPFNPLNRSPQIRFDYEPFPSIKIAGAALAHGYHASVGPEDAQRNSGLPDLQFQLHVGNSQRFNTGITAGYMWLKPMGATVNNNVYFSDNIVGAYNLQWFGRVKANRFTLQAKASFGENMTHQIMIGGYGRQLADSAKLYDYDYANIKSFAAWAEAMYDFSENWGFGFFVGTMSALGSDTEIETPAQNAPIWYTRAANISNGYRLSPRIVYSHKNFMLALEYLYNTADYGTTYDEFAKPQDFTQSINHRFLFAARYSF